MRCKYYGDRRDLVKWGVLLHIARDHCVGRILQVAYFRPSEWGQLEIDRQQRPIPKEVLSHFRNLRNIEGLTNSPRIELLASPFEDRQCYIEKIVQALNIRRCKETCVVFLDPDTGLEPRKPNLNHVLESELAEIWCHLIPGDILVFYQHQTNKKGEPWIEQKREQFENALGLARGVAKVAVGSTIASDVAFFYCRKEGS
jgi:hypothetical protein